MTEKSQRDPAAESGEPFSEGPSRAEMELDSKSDPPSPSEISRQVAFYGRLLTFEREVLERMRGFAADHNEDLRRAVELSNIQPMESLIEQLEERLRFWQQRERELSSD